MSENPFVFEQKDLAWSYGTIPSAPPLRFSDFMKMATMVLLATSLFQNQPGLHSHGKTDEKPMGKSPKSQNQCRRCPGCQGLHMSCLVSPIQVQSAPPVFAPPAARVDAQSQWRRRRSAPPPPGRVRINGCGVGPVRTSKQVGFHSLR